MNINRKLTIGSCVKTLAIKIYEEQIEDSFTFLKDRIQNFDKNTIQILMIKHNKDTENNDIWLPACKKPHFHIAIRLLSGKNVHIGTILNELKINFRKEIDDNLWNHHGVETIRNFSAMANYLTHETKESELDGKYKYDIKDIISNMNTNEIIKLRQEYECQCYEKTINSELVKLDQVAFNLGYDVKDFDFWYNNLPFQLWSNSKMKTIRESYLRGATKKYEEKKALHDYVFIYKVLQTVENICCK